jgi:alanine racemase
MEIDLSALAHNADTLRSRLAPGTRIIAALKGDAYGHGIGPVARRLADCGVETLATGNLRDAQAIRAAGVDNEILMFAGPLPEGMATLLEAGLTPTVHDWTSARAISSAAKQPTRVYVKVDSGLGRLGIGLGAAREFVHRVRELDNIVVHGIYTHLSFHDKAGVEWARERYAAFDALLVALEEDGLEIPVTQALASSALLAGLESRANAVCPGGLLYGMSPVDKDVAIAAEYRPVVSAIKGRLIHVGEPGDPLKPARVGVVPIGLADGYLAVQPASGAYVLHGGQRVPLKGVSLEYIVLDLSDFESARVGDEIVMLGESGSERIGLEQFASWQGAAPHASLLAFEGRLAARYLE